MRGEYKNGQKRVLTGSVYKIVIGVIVALAVALTMVLLLVMPALDDEIVPERTIVSIQASEPNVGVGNDISQIFVLVTYSDGSSVSVPLSGLTCDGLDVRVPGQQNVVLSYGGFEQTLTFTVQNVDCHIRYTASVGGRIQGESDQYVPNAGRAATVVAVPEIGYRFSGWSDGYPYASRTDSGITEDKEIMAIFEKAKFRVRFYYFDGTIASEEDVLYGEMPTKVPNENTDPKMKRYGYVFDSWVPNEFSNITRDMTIYPQYHKAATDLTMYCPNDVYGRRMGRTDVGGDLDDNSDPNAFGEVISSFYAYDKPASIVAAADDSRTLDRWEILSSDGTYVSLPAENGRVEVRVGSGTGESLTFTSMSEGNTVGRFILSFTPNEYVDKIEVRAVFVYERSNIRFLNYQNPENGNVEAIFTGLEHGKTIGSYRNENLTWASMANASSEANAIFKTVTGMEFVCWYRQGDPDQTPVNEDDTFEQDTNLIAKWRRRVYPVHFTYPDGSVVTIQVTYGDTLAGGWRQNGAEVIYGIPRTMPEKPHMAFEAWYDTATEEPVDNDTRLYITEKHLNSEEFKEDDGFFMAPRFAAIPHKLYVDITGEGRATVDVYDKFGVTTGDYVTEEVYGEYVLSEDKSYVLKIIAGNGSEIASYAHWVGTDIAGGKPTEIGEDDRVRETTIELDSTLDNSVNIVFRKMKVSVIVENGTDAYWGKVEYGDEIFDAANFELKAQWGEAPVLKILSGDYHSIESISVNGEPIGVDFGTDTTEYTLNLPVISENITVSVTYGIRRVNVNIGLNDDSFGEVYLGEGLTPLTMAEYNQMTFEYGSVAAFRLRGASDMRKVLSSVRINGAEADIFANVNSSAVHFYNWEINGIPYGVTVRELAPGEYYYVYGEFSVSGAVYVLAQSFDSENAVIFEKIEPEAGAAIYSLLAADSENYASVRSELLAKSDFANKNVYNVNIMRDLRVTAVDIMVVANRSYNIALNFSDITYQVTAQSRNTLYGASGGGSVETSATQTGYLGSATLTAAPLNGYYVAGYTVNGGDIIEVQNAGRGAAYTLNLTDITEDKSVVFLFSPLSYSVIITNETPSVAAAYADGALLNTSAEFIYDFHDIARITLTAAEGYVIEKLTIDGKDIALNVDSYIIYIPDIREDRHINVQLKKAEEESAGTYEIITEAADGLGNVSTSGKYIDPDKDAQVYVYANEGYVIESITVTDGATIYDAGDCREKESCDFIIPKNTFPSGAKVSVRANFVAKIYSLETVYVDNAGAETSDSANGTVSFGDDYGAFNAEVEVTVTASSGYYIAKVELARNYDGVWRAEEIEFDHPYWIGEEFETDIQTGRYSRGKMRFTQLGDMRVIVRFSPISYRISVDRSSVNGTTVLTAVDDGGNELTVKDGNELYAPSGSYINIHMTAATGYHIAALTVNGEAIPMSRLNFGSADENNHNEIIYTYTGAGDTAQGISGAIVVRVTYEINHYGFYYTIVNDSANFSDDIVGAGRLEARGLESRSESYFYGIEHGSNFSFEIYPSSTSGYYLDKIVISYTDGSGTSLDVEKTLGNRQLSASGGTIWFNSFVDSGEGVRSDIKMITVTFKRNFYVLDLYMPTPDGEAAGSMSLILSKDGRTDSIVRIFDQDNVEYIYMNGIIYSVDPDTRERGEATDIALRYIPGETEEERRYAFVDGLGNEYTFMIEHGIYYTVTATPARGYERTEFTVNGADRNSSLRNNAYNSNMARDMIITAGFTMLTYDVNFEISVRNANETAVRVEQIRNYARIRIIILEGTVYDLAGSVVSDPVLTYDLEYGEDRIVLSTSNLGSGIRLGYGSRIALVMLPNFDSGHRDEVFGDPNRDGLPEQGYYLSEFRVNGVTYNSNTYDFSIFAGVGSEENGDKYSGVSFTGTDRAGVFVEEDITATCTFRIMQYNVTQNITYDEAGLSSDVLNRLTAETGRIAYWGSSALVRVDKGEGYDIEKITVTRYDGITGGVLRTVSVPLIDDGMTREDYFRESERDANNVLRSVIHMDNVRGNVEVNVLLKRREFVIRFVINDASLLEAGKRIKTYFNSNNPTYPAIIDENGTTAAAGSVAWDGDVMTLRTHYYDELRVLLNPAVGYEIVAATVDLYQVALVDGEWVRVEENGKTMQLGLMPLSRTDPDRVTNGYSSDAKYFEMNRTSVQNSTRVECDLEVMINLSVKVYSADTTMTFERSQTPPADTVLVSLNSVTRNGANRESASIDPGNNSTRIMVEHNGQLCIRFTAPLGYMLASLNVNGYSVNDFVGLGSDVIDGRMTFAAERVETQTGVYSYSYDIYLNINDTLLNGRTSIEVNFRIRLITLNIVTFINGEEYITGNDGTTLNVVGNKSLLFYSNFDLAPTVYEGYSIRSLRVRTGSSGFAFGKDYTQKDAYESLDAIAYKDSVAFPGDEDYATDGRTALRAGDRFAREMAFSTFPYVDALSGKTTIYFFYETEIARYNIKFSAFVYSHEIPGASSGVERTLDALDINDIGGVTVNADGEKYEPDKAYEYFTVITFSAFATIRTDGGKNYGLYSVEEYIDGRWVDLASQSYGNRGIRNRNVNPDSAGREHYSFEFTVNSLADREFRVVYKQHTTVTVNIPNPFRYNPSQRTYTSYIEFKAFENGGERPNIETIPGQVVTDKYVYDIMVGNVVTFEYRELIAGADTRNIRYMTKSGETYENANLGEADSVNHRVGTLVEGPTEYTLFNNVPARITFTTETYGASANTGGEVYFRRDTTNAREVFANGSYAPTDETTRVNERIIMRVHPLENYVFAGLEVRQINTTRSYRDGQVTFMTGSDEWVFYSAEEADSFDCNNFIITGGEVKSEGKEVNYEFKITMRGDMELRLRFFRVYKMTVGASLADADGLADFVTVDNVKLPSTVQDIKTDLAALYRDKYVSDTSSDSHVTYVLYGSSVDVTSHGGIPDGYAFIGWHLNDLNVLEDVDIGLPEQNNSSVTDRREDIETTFNLDINTSEGASLYSQAAGEAKEVQVIGYFQPIIDLALINEIYYYSAEDKHWNSWESGVLGAQIYEYNLYAGEKTAPSYITAIEATNTSRTSLDEGVTALESAITGFKDYGSGFTGYEGMNMTRSSVDDKLVSLKDLSGYNIYRSVKTSALLYKDVENGNFRNMSSWVSGYIDLSIGNMSPGVKLVSWQYYNWNEQAFRDIKYTYYSFNMPVDCTDTNYTLSLDYLFSGEMPYAISTQENNRYYDSLGTSDSSLIRPLVIRPFLVKTVTVSLSQFAYTKYFTDPDSITDQSLYTNSFDDAIHPHIDKDAVLESDQTYGEGYTPSNVTNNTADNGMTGEYEYGSTITIYYYDDNENVHEIFKTNEPKDYVQTTGSVDERYRFLGWQLKWAPNGSNNKYSYIWNDTLDGSGDLAEKINDMSGLTIKMTWAMNNDPSESKLDFRAMYIKQFRQNLYSYNVAFNESSFAQAANGTYAYMDAPRFKVEVEETKYDVDFYNPFLTLGNGAGSRTPTQLTDKQYSVEATRYLDLESAQSPTKYNPGDWTFDAGFFADVGCGYILTVDYKTTVDGKNTSGYDPTFDKPYRYTEFLTTDSGEGDKNTEVMGEKFVEETKNTHDFKVEGRYMLNMQYYSQVYLELTNVMYGAGVTITAEMANYLTNGEKSSMTIWDNDLPGLSYDDIRGTYGNNPGGLSIVKFAPVKVDSANEERINYPDGKIEISFPLIGYSGNMGGDFYYLIRGMNDGMGIQPKVGLTYGNNQGKFLFSAENASYLRYVSIDYSNGYIAGGTLLFGNPNPDSGVDKYSFANTGDGALARITEDIIQEGKPTGDTRDIVPNITERGAINTSNAAPSAAIPDSEGKDPVPYMIYTADQLQNLTMVFKGNGNTLRFAFNSAGNGNNFMMKFQLANDIMLTQASTVKADGAPYLNASAQQAWIPLTYAYTGNSNPFEEHLGFDGYFDGQNHSLYGLIATSNTFKNANDGVKNGDFDFANLKGYGIFGVINNGYVANIEIGNAYLDLNTIGKDGGGAPDYVGLLASRIYTSTIKNVIFKTNDANKNYARTQKGVGSGSRIYISVAYNGTASNALRTQALMSGAGPGVGLLAGYVSNSTVEEVRLIVAGEQDTTVLPVYINAPYHSVGGLVGVLRNDTSRNNKDFTAPDSIMSHCYVYSDVSASSDNALYINSADGAGAPPNSGGLIGKMIGSIVEDCSLGGNLHVAIGRRAAINVGGMIGMSYGGQISRAIVRSPNSEVLTSGSTGIFLIASPSLTDDVAAVVDSNSSGKIGGVVGFAYDTYITGDNDLGKSKENTGIGGSIKFDASVAGGVAGVLAGTNGLIEAFDLYAPGYKRGGETGVSNAKLLFRMNNEGESFFGGLAGQVDKGAMVNDCGINGALVSDDKMETNAYTDISKAVIYAFREDDEGGYKYDSIDTFRTNQWKQMEFEENSTAKVRVGGLVGKLVRGYVYNSFMKSAKIMTNTYGGVTAPGTDYAWEIAMGGIVGIIDVPDDYNVNSDGNTDNRGWYDFLNDSEMATYNDSTGKFIKTSVQSCYVTGSIIDATGRFWVDNQVDGGNNLVTGAGAVDIGGIVGMTDTPKDTKNNNVSIGYNSYVINSVYSSYNTFVTAMGAYGLEGDRSDDLVKNTGKDVGWYTEENFTHAPYGHRDELKKAPNRRGFVIDGGMYGVVSGHNYDTAVGENQIEGYYALSDPKYMGGAANHSWASNNNVYTPTTEYLNDSGGYFASQVDQRACESGRGYPDKFSDGNRRGVGFRSYKDEYNSVETEKANVLGPNRPIDTYPNGVYPDARIGAGGIMEHADYYAPYDARQIADKSTMMGEEDSYIAYYDYLNSAIPGGAFVGYLNSNLDGRVYRTDKNTGLPMVMHIYATAQGQEDKNSTSCYFATYIDGVFTQYIGHPEMSYDEYLKQLVSDGTLSTYLVRGQ